MDKKIMYDIANSLSRAVNEKGKLIEDDIELYGRYSEMTSKFITKLYALAREDYAHKKRAEKEFPEKKINKEEIEER